MTSGRKSHSGKHSLTFNLYRSTWVGCGQLVWIHQTIAKDLELSAWSSAYGLEIDSAIYADVRYTDGTSSQDYTLTFGKGTFSWMRKSMLLRANKPVAAVMIYMVMEAGTSILGASYVDDISLIEMESSTPLPIPSPPEHFKVGAPHGVTAAGLLVQQHWCVAGQVCDTDLRQFHMHNYFLTASATPKTGDVTLVTQLSPDRLHRIQQLARVWKGPISAAVYVGRDTYGGVQKILSLWGASEHVRTHVDVHLVSIAPIGHRSAAATTNNDDDDDDNKKKKKNEEMTPYPINALRNLAWQYARTNQLFLLDVDFIPNPDMRKYVVDLWPKLRAVKGLEKSVYVIPGFESFQSLKQWPRTRADVFDMAKTKFILQPVHADKLASAHAAVDYERWYETTNPYRINYRLYFEPYLLVDRTMTPQYDSRFR